MKRKLETGPSRNIMFEALAGDTSISTVMIFLKATSSSAPRLRRPRRVSSASGIMHYIDCGS
jgi:hypothetical protein